MTPERTIVLRHSDRQADSESQGSGMPNYLGAPTISPDNSQAWVPGKQDNVKRGQLRNALGAELPEHGARHQLARGAEGHAAGAEDLPRASTTTTPAWPARSAYDPAAYLFVALETSRQVAVLDAHAGAQLSAWTWAARRRA
jgi:hypothetical protein